jgi:hypothetical protein
VQRGREIALFPQEECTVFQARPKMIGVVKLPAELFLFCVERQRGFRVVPILKDARLLAKTDEKPSVILQLSADQFLLSVEPKREGLFL